MIFDRAHPDFLHHRATEVHECAFLSRKGAWSSPTPLCLTGNRGQRSGGICCFFSTPALSIRNAVSATSTTAFSLLVYTRQPLSTRLFLKKSRTSLNLTVQSRSENALVDGDTPHLDQLLPDREMQCHDYQGSQGRRMQDEMKGIDSDAIAGRQKGPGMSVHCLVLGRSFRLVR